MINPVTVQTAVRQPYNFSSPETWASALADLGMLYSNLPSEAKEYISEKIHGIIGDTNDTNDTSNTNSDSDDDSQSLWSDAISPENAERARQYRAIIEETL